MKTVILIIFMRGWGGEAVAVHSVEFYSMDACKKASQQLLAKEKSNKDRMTHLLGTYTCVEK